MTISHPFTIDILNKEVEHPLQAASNHSGEKMVDFTDECEFSPPKRGSVIALNDLILPPKDSPHYLSLPDVLQIKKGARPEVIRNTRNLLWLRVHWREKRANAQFARRFELALPPEIPLETAKKAVVDFAQQELISLGMVADLAIHELRQPPDEKGQTVVSRRAFLMCTTRPFEDGEFANKTRTWNDRGQLIAWRQAWFAILNQTLPPPDQRSQHSIALAKFAERFMSKSASLPTRDTPPDVPDVDASQATAPSRRPRL